MTELLPGIPGTPEPTPRQTGMVDRIKALWNRAQANFDESERAMNEAAEKSGFRVVPNTMYGLDGDTTSQFIVPIEKKEPPAEPLVERALEPGEVTQDPMHAGVNQLPAAKTAADKADIKFMRTHEFSAADFVAETGETRTERLPQPPVTH